MRNAHVAEHLFQIGRPFGFEGNTRREALFERTHPPCVGGSLSSQQQRATDYSRDVPGEVDSARNALKQAHNELQHAGGEWGGHRAKAMQYIQEAIAELNEAEKWAREHHEIK